MEWVEEGVRRKEMQMSSHKLHFQASNPFACKTEPAAARCRLAKLKFGTRFAWISQSTFMFGSWSTIQLRLCLCNSHSICTLCQVLSCIDLYRVGYNSIHRIYVYIVVCIELNKTLYLALQK